VQYTCSRIASVVAKSKIRPSASIEHERLSAPLEKEVLLKLADYPRILEQAQQENDPSIIARYVFELAQLFSTLYQQLPILNAEAPVSKARISLAQSVRMVLTNGLTLLGIETLDQM
jgi:arginyl-tRNA synthetase